MTREPPQRIGLSATCAPLATVAAFLVGTERSCAVAQVADATEKRFAIEPLFESVDYSPGWMAALLDRLADELAACRTTLIFTNTRNLAERLTWALRRRYPDRCDEIGVHHSAISAARRRAVERRLKHGQLWTIVSSTSLELGIDIGTVDSVVFVHPPGGVVRLLQRVGRSGHRPDQPRRGLLLTASPSELLEAAVTASSGRDGQLEAVRMIDAPLDVLCQQPVGLAMTGGLVPRRGLRVDPPQGPVSRSGLGRFPGLPRLSVGPPARWHRLAAGAPVLGRRLLHDCRRGHREIAAPQSGLDSD